MEHAGNYVAGWGTLALINAGLAQGKNRSGLAWFRGTEKVFEKPPPPLWEGGGG